MARKKISTTVYVTEEQQAKLKFLHGATRIPVSEFVREGIDAVLKKYASQLIGFKKDGAA